MVMAPSGSGAFGKVDFATSCDPKVKDAFNAAVARLHSFEPAVDDFRAVAEADPHCAMAWWGAAMSARGNPLTGALSDTARQEGASLLAWTDSLDIKTPRERAYVDALRLYFHDHGEGGHPARTRAYEAAMARLHQAWPDDPDATAFYALAILEAVDLTDKTYARQLEAAAVLEDLWRRQPDHPGAPHYLIHAYDYPPLAQRGLPAARAYARIAPASVHARHMPSHIFTLLGLWRESIAANQAAAALVAPASAPDTPARDTAFLHGFDFIEYARLQLGQDKAVAADLALIRATQGRVALFEARDALERGDWRAAAAVPTSPDSPLDDALGRLARALGAARLGDLPAARREARALHDLREPVRQTENDYWAGLVDVYAAAADAWVAKGEGRMDSAVALMARAASLDDAREKHINLENRLLPMRELYGELLLEIGRPADALEAFRASLTSSPNRYRSLAGAARAAAALGQADAALTWRQALLDLTRDADTQRPEMVEARAALGSAH